ncbi:hypothetical protein [Streptosporangium sp. NPDC000396]
MLDPAVCDVECVHRIVRRLLDAGEKVRMDGWHPGFAHTQPR